MPTQTPGKKAAYMAREASVCAYHRSRDYSHGGHLPCGTCYRCEAAREALARLQRWNAETDAGADPRR